MYKAKWFQLAVRLAEKYLSTSLIGHFFTKSGREDRYTGYYIISMYTCSLQCWASTLPGVFVKSSTSSLHHLNLLCVTPLGVRYVS